MTDEPRRRPARRPDEPAGTIDPDPRASRARILDAAEALFAERGFDGASMRDLATAAGLQPASLYNHFPGKHALYEAVLERGIRPVLDEIARVAAAGVPRDGGDAIVAALVSHVGRRPHVPRLLQHEAARGGEHLAELARRFLRPLFAQGVAALKLRPDTRLWHDDELSLLLAAFMHLIFGPFAMAPLLREVMPVDPRSPEGIEQQTRFLQKLVRLLMGATESPNGEPSDETR